MGEKSRVSTLYKYIIFIHKSLLSDLTITPLALAICVSPLALLVDTNMTRAGTLPSWTSLASHVCRGLTLPSPSDATIVMENAILHVVLRTCQRGSLAVGDLSILNNAWGYIHSTPSPLSQLANSTIPPNRRKRPQQDQTDDERQAKNPRKPRLRRDKPDDDEIDELEDEDNDEGMDLRTFTARFSIPNIDDVESWPELVIPDLTFNSPSPISHPPQEKVR